MCLYSLHSVVHVEDKMRQHYCRIEQYLKTSIGKEEKRRYINTVDKGQLGEEEKLATLTLWVTEEDLNYMLLLSEP